MPPTGYEFVLGPFVYKVTYVSAGKLRFSAELSGVKEDKRDHAIAKPTVQETAKILAAGNKFAERKGL
jgi:hypothetical protein